MASSKLAQTTEQKKAKQRECMSRSRAANPQRTLEKNREYWLRHKYDMSMDEYHAMLFAQEGKCGICQQRPPFDVALAVDHCHDTGLVRGLLCRTCNTGIGHLKDSPELLRRALQYLTDGE